MQENNKRLLLICFALVAFGLGCLAAFDLGAMHTCSMSGGTLLRTYECVINDSLGYCHDGSGRYLRPYFNTPTIPQLNVTIP